MELRNIIGVTDLGCKLNLKDISLKVPTARYNPYRFSGLTLRISSPKASAQVFSSGKVVCLGTKSLDELDLAGREFARLLALLGYEVKFNSFTIKNMVGSCSAGFRINLGKLVDNHGGIFEPELFPAFQKRVENVTLLIFHSGKIIATGAKTKEEIDHAYNKIYPALGLCAQ
jgi:transcription initiation factor TFIID TATA-box-binding protein